MYALLFRWICDDVCFTACNAVVDASQEDNSQMTYSAWPDEAVRYLISLYSEYESDLEDPRKKKKDIWKVITEKMNSKGHMYSQNKVESKWRSLLKSHKDVRDNKKRTGAKRKSFRFYQEIEEIIAKRHDINPPFTGGSGCPLPKESDKDDCSKTGSDVSTNLEQQPKSRGADENEKDSPFSSDNVDDLDASSSKLSGTKGAIRKRENRKRCREPDVPSQMLEFLKEAEEKRIELYRERQKERREQDAAKIELLKEIVSSLKK